MTTEIPATAMLRHYLIACAQHPHPWWTAWRLLARSCGLLLSNVWTAVGRPHMTYSIPILHEGISQAETGTWRRDLCARWLSELRLVPPGSIRYVVVHPPRAPHPEYLLRRHLLQGFGTRNITRLLVGAARSIALAVRFAYTHGSVTGVLAAAAAIRVQFYTAVIVFRRPRLYLTTSSGLFPDTAAATAFRTAGLPAVAWSYSQNVSLFSATVPLPHYRVDQALPAVEAISIWTPQHGAQLQHSEKRACQHPLFGPTMMGDPAYVRQRPADVRQDYGLAFTPLAVGIFDVAAHAPSMQHKLWGTGPTELTADYCSAFYDLLWPMLANLPRTVMLLYSQKRTRHKGLLDLSAQRAFHAHPRILQLVPGMDPYRALGLCDIVIAQPFSSMVIAAWQFGRLGFWFDPLSRCRYHLYPECESLIAHGPKECEEMLTAMCNPRQAAEYRHLLNSPIFRPYRADGVPPDSVRDWLATAKETGEQVWRTSRARPA